MKTDQQLMTDVAAELAWGSSLKTNEIGISVKNGVVTLSGDVETYAQKYAAERAVGRVSGVHGIAMDLNVKLMPNHQRSDTEIAQAALSALQWHCLVPDGNIQVKVEKGFVTLLGEVERMHQKKSAEHCVRPLMGVCGVANHITLKPEVDIRNINTQIASALARRALSESQNIHVQAQGSVVTLSGVVGTMAERDAVIQTAYGAPGVTSVLNRLVISG